MTDAVSVDQNIQPLKFDTIAGSEMHDDPFPWTQIDNVLRSDDHALTLAEQLPDILPLLTQYPERDHSVIRGSFENSSFIEGGFLTELGSNMTGDWRDLIDSYLDPGYRAAISKLTKLDLEDCPFRLRLTHTSHNYALEPHIDSGKTRFVTHILYWNQTWQDDWGGHLRILRSDDAEDVAAKIAPRLNSSSLMVGTDNSWHAVEPLAPSAPQSRFRLMAIIHPPDFKGRLLGEVKAGESIEAVAAKHGLPSWVIERWLAE